MNVGLLIVAFATDEVDSTQYARLRTDPDSIMDMYMEDPESETYKQLFDEYMASTTYDEYLQKVRRCRDESVDFHISDKVLDQ